MSLIDLYTHLLSQPIDMLLLHHILTSIVMISDMFVLSSQYDWMLQTFLKLLESHPPEDVLSESLLAFGTIKSAAVLRIVSIGCIISVCMMRVCVCWCRMVLRQRELVK